MSDKNILNPSGVQNKQSCVELFNLQKCPELGTTPKISLHEPREQSRSVLRYPVELGLQTWNANSTMSEVCAHTYCLLT